MVERIVIDPPSINDTEKVASRDLARDGIDQDLCFFTNGSGILDGVVGEY
jgi:hypothetical protein